MTRRVEHHFHQLLRLIRRHPGADSKGMSYRFVQIVDFEVEMDHHLLIRGSAGPDRRHEIGLGGESLSHASIGGSQRHPVRLDFSVAAAKLPLIEGSEEVGVG